MSRYVRFFTSERLLGQALIGDSFCWSLNLKLIVDFLISCQEVGASNLGKNSEIISAENYLKSEIYSAENIGRHFPVEVIF